VRKLHLLLLSAFSCFLLHAVTTQAQFAVNPTNTGLAPNGVFSGTSIENIQINNGNLHVDIPVWAVKGRGLDTEVHFIYDNKGWTSTTLCIETRGNPVCTDSIQPTPGNHMILGALSPWSGGVSNLTRSQTCAAPTVNVTLRTNMTCPLAPRTGSYDV
jgi:hypothetical protein